MSPQLLVLQTDREVPAGLLQEQLAARGAAVAVHELGPGTPLPSGSWSCDGLVLLRALPSAVEGFGDQAMAALPDLIRLQAERRRPTLGFGLGAQLIASALGGAVRAGAAPEFGYVDLVPTALAADDPVLRGIGAGLPVMEWHEDGLDLPAGAEVLARCQRARVQAFRVTPWVHGLRFHPGVDSGMVRRWAVLRGRQRNNPAVAVRIGAEIVRHQERAERFGLGIAEGWLGLVAAAA